MRIFEGWRLLSKAVGLGLWAIGTARADYATRDIAAHEAAADFIAFESRAWAEGADGSGGRLAANTVWEGGEYVVLSDLYVPAGVTLTLGPGAVVRFREGTRIHVEDGGSLVLNGEAGNEVVLEGYAAETAFGGLRLQSGAANYSDNTHVIVRGFAFGRFASVSLGDTTAFAGGGQALVPVSVSGSRDTAFSFDWVAETNGVAFASGTMAWGRVSEGPKNIAVPFAAGLPGCTNFTVRAATLRCCTAARGAANVTLSEFITADIAAHEAAAGFIAFESRDWAAAVVAAAEADESVAVEGGRLQANTVWTSDRTHLVAGDLYIPAGVTLTLTADAVVEFCEGTKIKVEDGGSLIVNGAAGHDVILRGRDGTTAFEGIRLQSGAASYADNSYVAVQGFAFERFAGVALHDSTTFRSSGLALVPVTVSGSRTTAFSIDWVAETNGAPYKAGSLGWGGVSEGTKNIRVDYGEELAGCTDLVVRVAVDRACHSAPRTATVRISDFLTADIAAHETTADFIAFESRDWAAEVQAAAADASVAVEGGRLQANTVWTSDRTHLITGDLYIPAGVTLTLTADAVVEFCEGTKIKVEDGGALNAVGAAGHDVILRGYDGTAAFEGIRLQSGAATYADNMYVQIQDVAYAGYPAVAVHAATTYRDAGTLYVPVTLGGASRSQAFNIDWETDKGDAGTLAWGASSEGTKWIPVPLAPEAAGGTTNHALRITAARGCSVATGRAALAVMEPDYPASPNVALAEGGEASDAFTIDGGVRAQPLFLNAVETVQYSGRWQTYDADEAATLRVTLETDNGKTVLKESPPDETGAFDLRLADWPVGHYTLRHEVLNGLGETLATMDKTFSIADVEDVELHGGTLTDNEMWGADKVHVVYEMVVVPSVYTLFIEPGAIVKFMTGTGIDISQGGALFANRIVFTHINDDTVGGDTLSDGYTVAPPMDAYTLSGNFTFGDDTELRGITQDAALTGTIATQRTLSRGSTYRVSGTLTIANGGSLTIPPGTVLKMEAGASLVVGSGGTLNAVGTRAAPIVFTSIRDDEYSGDTNGDGDKTYPQPGDWTKIGVNGGTANLEFVSILYASRNATTGAINMNGGTVRFVNSEIAHGLYDAVGVESGGFFMTNSVIRDCLLAFRHWAKDPIVNSVVYDCGRLTQGGSQTFVNCIFANIAETWEAFGFPRSAYRNCCFWNEGGSVLDAEGAQDAMSVCGADGNVWGDPLFLDPDSGDFRIVEGSPCVDAADGAAAPEHDYYGQPRITITEGSASTNLVGQLADIGLCEVMPRDVVSDIDLVPQSVRTVTNAVPGQLLFVKWEVANRGGVEVDAAWRDTVSLVSASGREVALGDKTTTSRIGVGGSVFCSGYFTVPAISEGEWFPKVNVNSYHDIFEGSLAANNALVGDRAVVVGLEPLDPSVSREGVLNSGVPTILRLAYGEADENRMVRLDVPSGVRVSWGFGFMPQGASRSGAATAGGGGVMFRVPDGAADVYVVMESDASAAYALSTDAAKLAITSVTPDALPSSGTTTLTIEGAGFGEDCEVVLSSAAGRHRLPSVAVDAAGRLVVPVDCAALTAGAVYDVVVANKADETSASLPNALTVTKAEGFWEIESHLILPDSVRLGREMTGYVEYKNVGTIPAPVPVFILSSSGARLRTSTQSPAWAQRISLYGTDSSGMKSIPADSTVKIPFSFVVMSNDTSVVKLETLDESALVDYDAVYAMLGDEEVYQANAVSNLYGQTWGDFASCIRGYLAECPVNSVYGFNLAELTKDYLRHFDDSNCTGRLIGIVYDEYGNKMTEGVEVLLIPEKADGPIYTATTDNKGVFYLEGITNGLYHVNSPCKNTLRTTDIQVSGACAVRDVVLSAGFEVLINLEKIDTASIDDLQIHAGSKVLGKDISREISGEKQVSLVLSEGEWDFYLSSKGRPMSTLTIVRQITKDTVIEFSRVERFRIEGVAMDAEGNRLVDCKVSLGDSDVACLTSADGVFSLAGVCRGDALLSIAKDDYCTFVTNLIVEEDVVLMCCLERGVFVKGILANIQESSLTGSMLVLANKQDGTFYVTQVGEDGDFEVTVKPGEYEISAEGVPSIGFLAEGDLVEVHLDVGVLKPNVTVHEAKTATKWLRQQILSANDGSNDDELAETEAVMFGYLGAFNVRACARMESEPAEFMANYLLNVGRNNRRPKGYEIDKPWVVRANSSLSRAAKTASPVHVRPYASVRPRIEAFLKEECRKGTLKNSYQLGQLASCSVYALDYNIIGNSSIGMYLSSPCLSFGGMDNGNIELKVTTKQHNPNDGSYTLKTVYIGHDRYDFNRHEHMPAVSDAVVAALLRKFGYQKKDFYGSNGSKAYYPYILQEPNWATPFYTALEIADAFFFKIEPLDDQEPGRDEDYGELDIKLSVDPNEMVGPEGEGDPETERFVRPGEWMTYTVYFENVSNATAAAQEVYVTNPLSEYLDWDTFEMGEVAFNNQIDLGLAGKASGTSEATMNGTNFLVRTTLALDRAAGVASWYLRIVDPTTDTGWPTDILAGFLPPNDETFRGEGHLTYRVRVREDAPGRVKIVNGASIVFDYNDPIETDPAWWNTVAEIAHVAMTVDGAATNLSLIVGMPYGELPEPTGRAGYTFGGWYTGANGAGRRVRAQDAVQAGDAALHARWLANAYAVRFDANGGEGVMSSQALTFDEPAALDANAFTRAHHDFAGWATNATTSALYADGAVVTNLTASDGGQVDLFATWAPRTYTVRFEPRNGGAATVRPVAALAPVGAPPAAPVRAGYVFRGWFTAAADGEPVTAATVVSGDAVYWAQWEPEPEPDPDPEPEPEPAPTPTAPEPEPEPDPSPVVWAVRLDANGGTLAGRPSKAVADGEAVGRLPEPVRAEYVFAGWYTGAANGVPVTAETRVTADATYYAHWEEAPPALYEAVAGAPDLSAAGVWDGWLVRDGAVAGTLQVKVAKAGRSGAARVSAAVAPLGGRKVTVKASLAAGETVCEAAAKDGRALRLAFGDDELGGAFDGCALVGARSLFASKRADDRAAAADVLDRLKGAVNVAWRTPEGMSSLSVTVAAKGRAKIAGTLAGGAKVSGAGQMAVGARWCVVPVACSRKGASAAFVLWLRRDGSALRVQGLDDEPLAGRVETPRGELVFRLGGGVSLAGAEVVESLLPTNLAFQGGAKWRLPKAGSVRRNAATGLYEDVKETGNPAGLKLAYTARTGAFKGSFKVYAEVNGRLRKYSAAVSGVMVGGRGYGTATVKGGGSVAVTVE